MACCVGISWEVTLENKLISYEYTVPHAYGSQIYLTKFNYNLDQQELVSGNSNKALHSPSSYGVVFIQYAT